MSLYPPTRWSSWLVPSHLLYLKPLAARDKSPCTPLRRLLIHFYILCTDQWLPALLPTDTTWPLTTTATNHHFSISCIHLQSFVNNARFSYTSTKLLHCWCIKYQVIKILTLDVYQPSRICYNYIASLCTHDITVRMNYSSTPSLLKPIWPLSQYPIKCLL